jgi:DNA-directed RNA polymerase subunit RPC12/RpoP
MSVENGKCSNCGAPLLLDTALEKGTCKYCGCEFLIPQAVQKIKVDGIATFDALMLAAQTAIEFDGDYDKARNKYREALNVKPDDYRIYWDLFLCETDAIAWYIRKKGFIQYPGDVPQNIQNAVARYARRAELYAPADRKEYYRQTAAAIAGRLSPPVPPKKKRWWQ